MPLDIKKVLRFIRFWPPYLASGIAVERYNDDITSITVRMKMWSGNRNYVGTHFGGNLYSMCDPWYMFILLHHLGSECVVWDKEAHIDFVSPSKGTVYATFEISKDTISDLKQLVQDGKKHLPSFETTIQDREGNVVAKLTKILYVRKKRSK
jgi:hypothetical protein